MDSKVSFTKTHIWMATCSYAAQRGDKKAEEGSNRCSSVCRCSIMDAQASGSTPDNYRLFYVSLCLSPSAVPLSLPFSALLQACLGSRTSHRRDLPSALLLKTWVVDARVDAQLHRLPYSLAGVSCWGHVGPLFTRDKNYKNSKKLKVAVGSSRKRDD